ncbi:MAG: arginine--tRNA ligase [Candidatus Moraniibacteriota bacterium]|nr:MAG: arginine--tRNA ligase [Candidatus Moranbacteria bacterium]
MKESIKKSIKKAIEQLQSKQVWGDFVIPEVIVERPKDLSHGDWMTNIAFVLAKELKKAPLDIAEELAGAIEKDKNVESVDVVQPGYVNFILVGDVVNQELKKIVTDGDVYGKNNNLDGKKIMVEYTQPNPFKPFHIGHLMSNTIGESVSRIVEFSGASVIRANYQGDVGPHVAKAIWGLKKLGYEPTDINKIGEAYAYGHAASENDEKVQSEIQEINKIIYQRSDESLMKIYEEGREKTLERFEEIYAILGTSFDQYFFESETWQRGEDVVRAHIGDVFEKSDGAVIFPGEKYGLHTRVFITAQGLPTYEAKEIGLALLKKEKNSADIYIITTAVEQEEYFKVVKKAIELIDPSFEGKITHVAHGMMQLTSGKMSSRKGNVVTGELLIENAQNVARKKMSDRVKGVKNSENIINTIAVAGIKFSILKQRSGKNIIFNPETALSFDGDSGPYIQYTYARCQSIIQKAIKNNIEMKFSSEDRDGYEMQKILAQFGEVVLRASEELAPHHISNYLLDVAHAYNVYYTNNVIIDVKDQKRSQYRIALTVATAQIIKNGMNLLGIDVPEKM